MEKSNVHVGMLVKRLADALERKANENMRGLGMTHSQARVLYELSEAKSHMLSFRRLKELLGVSQPTAWGLVNRLEAKGMVRTRVDPDDARAKLVYMTELGQSAYDEAYARMDEFEAILTSGLTAEDVCCLKEYLRHICSNCETS